MTSLAKVEANRRNAKLSTGPRTAAGKAAVARNAIRHGAFAHLPVVPGENPYDWDRHRAGIIASLAPAGLLEVNLAERAALLLWRLARLSRFEAGTTGAAVEDAGLLPETADPFTAALFPPGHRDENYLKLTDQNLVMARKNRAEVTETAELLRRAGDPEWCGPILTEHAVAVLGWAFELASEYPLRKSNPDHMCDPGFLSALGLSGTLLKDVAWTPELLRRGLTYYAAATGMTAAEFRANVGVMIERRVEALTREVRRLEAEADAIVRRSESARARSADAALLLAEPVAERVMKYEKHLHAQLAATLRELERLQTRRGWEMLSLSALRLPD